MAASSTEQDDFCRDHRSNVTLENERIAYEKSLQLRRNRSAAKETSQGKSKKPRNVLQAVPKLPK